MSSIGEQEINTVYHCIKETSEVCPLTPSSHASCCKKGDKNPSRHLKLEERYFGESRIAQGQARPSGGRTSPGYSCHLHLEVTPRPPQCPLGIGGRAILSPWCWSVSL